MFAQPNYQPPLADHELMGPQNPACSYIRALLHQADTYLQRATIDPYASPSYQYSIQSKKNLESQIQIWKQQLHQLELTLSRANSNL